MLNFLKNLFWFLLIYWAIEWYIKGHFKGKLIFFHWACTIFLVWSIFIKSPDKPDYSRFGPVDNRTGAEVWQEMHPESR